MIERVVYTPAAESDLDEAFERYEAQEPGLGHRFLHAVTDHPGLSQGHPELYPAAGRNCRRAPTRRFPYEIFYGLTPEDITIHCVFHSSQDPRRWRERLRRASEEG